MQAVVYTRQGPAREVLVLSELNAPLPGPGEVRVRVKVSGINPADVKRRAGAPSRPMPWPIIIPHNDAAGIVDALGPGVRSVREGDRVWVWAAQWRAPFGTAAQYVVVPEAQAVPLPSGVSFDVGAAIGVPALTAHRCLSVVRHASSRRVLVFGGAGSIGQILVQLLAAQGSQVVSIVSSARKCAIAESVGAEIALDYTAPDFATRLERLAGLEGFDVLIDVDMGAHCARYTRWLARHGQVVVYGSASNMLPQVDVLALQKHGVSMHFVAGADQPEVGRAIEDICAALAAGVLRPRIQQSYRLEEVAAAHEAVEAGSLEGKVVLELPEND